MTQICSPTLFLPGTQCDERVWMPVWQCIDFTQRSFVPLQWAESLDQMLALTQDRIDAYQQKVDLIGFSMGGFIASLAALKSPQKVNSLTLIGYDPKGLDNIELERRKGVLSALDKNQLPPFSQARLRQYLTEAELHSRPIVDCLKQMDSDLGTSVLRAHIKATTPRTDLSLQLAKVNLPIHFICADEDQIASAVEIETYAKRLKHADFACLSQTAHMMLLSQPQQVANILIRYLAKE